MKLWLHCRSVRNAVVVYCAGRITFGEEATLLGNQIAALLAKGKRVYLHLGGVEVLDAAGLGTLAEMAVIAPACGGEIKLCNLPKQIAALLHLTRLSEILDVYESEEEARAAWREDFPEISSGIPAVV
jgi:anti-anti-sigma factor